MKNGDLIKNLFELREEKQRLAEETKKINEQIDIIEFELLGNMEEQEIDSLKNEHGSVTRKEELFPSIVDMDALFTWAQENGKPEIFQKRISSTVFKTYFEQNGCYPEGTTAHIKTKLNVRKK